MPKRSTLTFSSEDAPRQKEPQLFVYYCKYSGKHAFTTDVDLRRLPQRRTDGSRVLDSKQYTIKLYTTDGPAKLLRRPDGQVERQHRLNIGKLPVAYRSEQGGQYIYVMDGAVTSYVAGPREGRGATERVPVPPCITSGAKGTTEVKLDIEDKAPKALVSKVTASGVVVHITSNISHDTANPEIQQLLARLLGMRVANTTLIRGPNSRSRILIADGQNPQQVHEKLQAYLAKAGE